MQTDVKEGSVIGGAMGVFLWLYDFRHVLLGGPPSTRISDSVENFIPVNKVCEVGFEGANVVCGFISALLILAVIGIFAGMGLARLMRFAKR